MITEEKKTKKKKKKTTIPKHILAKFQNSKEKQKILTVSRREGKEKQLK